MPFQLSSDHPDISGLQASILEILEENELCTLAVIDTDNLPHAATVYYCYAPDLKIYFIADRNSIHGRQLVNGSNVALTVYDSHQSWDCDHKGLQLFGNCRMLSRVMSVHALAIHAARFKAYADYIHAMLPSEIFSSPYQFFCVEVTRAKVFDETKFGEETFIAVNVERHG